MKILIQMMMKKLVYKPGILLLAAFLLLPSGLAAQNKVSKEFHEEYIAKKGMTLDLDNKYGDIVVVTSESNQVVIDVKVTVWYPNRDRAEQLLSYIDVHFSEGANVISAKTVINDKFKFTGWSGESRKFTINYNVRMPEWMDLTLANRYGNTELDDLSGLVNLSIKYGNLTASRFTRGNEQPLNALYLAYGKGFIEEAGWMDIEVRYCGNLTIENSQALLVDSKYSKLALETTSSVVAETKYDNIKIENINNLIIETGYSDVNIGTLTKKLKFEGSYSGLNVDRVPSGFESIEVDTRYTGVRIGIDESASYKLNGKVTYGGLKFNEDNFNYIRRIIENNKSEVAGIVGRDESPSATVDVESSYGSVKLY
jgi:hypothetical protein